MRTVEIMTSSKSKKGSCSAKAVDEDKCEHDWEEIGSLIFYEKDAPVRKGVSNHECYEGYIRTDQQIGVFKCKKCREVTLKWNPWKLILEGERDD